MTGPLDRLRASLLLAALLSSAPTLVAASHNLQHPGLCGQPDPYMCGEILVILEPSASTTIGEIIARNGGTPATDLLYEFQAVLDLLDPDGMPDDLSAATVYGVAVPVGTEVVASQRFADDPDVYAAAVNRETIGSLTPNTATRHPRPWQPLLVSLGLAMAVVGLALALRRSRSRGER
jgi:hypothetical protein